MCSACGWFEEVDLDENGEPLETAELDEEDSDNELD